jgi:hypothetical protein
MVTNREIGQFEQIIRTLDHRARNDRQIVVLLGEKVARLEMEIQTLRVRLYTTISVVAGLGSLLAWVVRVSGTNG